MNNDLKTAKTDETFECLTYDLEKTLPLPRIPRNIVFYKRQLYNCGIHAGSSNIGYCYVWVEGDAGRGSQEICDSNKKIIIVNARYPGRVHDAFIWRHSAVRQEMKRLCDSRIGEYFLLGDSGYPLEPWLMTPILHAVNHSEEHYTEWHCRVRNGIERTNGYLKGSLRCLGIDRVLHYAPDKASELIYACCIVYNLMKHFSVSMESIEVPIEVEDGNNATPALLLRVARARRDELINTYFRA